MKDIVKMMNTEKKSPLTQRENILDCGFQNLIVMLVSLFAKPVLHLLIKAVQIQE